MKNKIVVILGVVVLATALFFAVATYNQHHKEQVAAQVAAQAKADQYAKELADARERGDALLLQCKTGADAWAKLTLAQQKTQPKPDCELSFQ